MSSICVAATTWFHTLLNYDADWSFWHLTSEVAKFSLEGYKSAGNYEAHDETSFASNLTFSDWWDGLVGAVQVESSCDQPIA
jgi:hypothetical protein